MPDKVTEPKGKRKLTPTFVGQLEPMREGSDIKVLHFNAKDESGAVLSYETFKQSLVPFIKVDKEIEAETELLTITTDGGQQYLHWRITEIYVNGKPIAPSRSQASQYRGRDEDRTDNRTAVLEIGQSWRAGKFADDNPLVDLYKMWLNVHIHGKVTKREGGKDEIPVSTDTKTTKASTEKKIPEGNDSGGVKGTGDDREGESLQWFKENLEVTGYKKWIKKYLEIRGYPVVTTERELLDTIKDMPKGSQEDLKNEIERRLKL